ncbi:hypothetical protein [Candidatus Vondammii sp. HM_W22]|uniref:hypothetical protein n=1 Tax=Candidatus Vondammii sp. HM_W22 TaxID=2687299 RepID=UPI00403DB35A
MRSPNTQTNWKSHPCHGSISGGKGQGKSKVNDTQIVTPKAARKNTSGEAMALARKRFRRRAGIEPVVT